MGNLALFGGSHPGVTPKHDAARSINFIPILPESPDERPYLRGRPGLSLITTLPKTPIRGHLAFDDRFFCVAGSSIYEVTASGYSEWGKIASTYGVVGMAYLNNVIVIGDGSAYYALDLTAGTVEQIVDAPRGRYPVYHKLRILYQGEDGQFFYSEPNDATDIPGLNFATAESLPDDILKIVSTENNLYLFGKDSTEVWYNSGDIDNPFEPVPSGVTFNGCAYPETALRLDNSVFWVGRDEQGSGMVFRMNGVRGQRVSTTPVERFIAQSGNVTACSYQEEGSTFYILNSEVGTWALDLKTNLWSERAWLNRNTGEQERHRVQHTAHALGGIVATDYALGKVYFQSLAYHSDAGQEIRCTRIEGIQADGRWITVDELFADFVSGTGLDGSGQGTDPKAMLEVALDGASYGNELTASIGAIGQYGNRCRWHRLGAGTDIVFKLSVSDPVLRILRGGDLRLRVGRR